MNDQTQRKLLTIEAIREKLADRNLSKVAQATGYTRAHIAQIRNGSVSNPSYKCLVALSDYFLERG